jgi:hypothetical protein
MPPGAPELPVRDPGQPDCLLLRYSVLNAAILDLAQRRVADCARSGGRTGALQLGRAQQAADLVGAEWWLGLRHPAVLR